MIKSQIKTYFAVECCSESSSRESSLEPPEVVEEENQHTFLPFQIESASKKQKKSPLRISSFSFQEFCLLCLPIFSALLTFALSFLKKNLQGDQNLRIS